ncbi:hypothetical protein MTBSS4_270047 [Magnetospirillum sp. SS-4]|nr:hypothetical protein MTBSS4_270047 [Magnetospirillum sp. SS-4]
MAKGKQGGLHEQAHPRRPARRLDGGIVRPGRRQCPCPGGEPVCSQGRQSVRGQGQAHEPVRDQVHESVRSQGGQSVRRQAHEPVRSQEVTDHAISGAPVPEMAAAGGRVALAGAASDPSRNLFRPCPEIHGRPDHEAFRHPAVRPVRRHPRPFLLGRPGWTAL